MSDADPKTAEPDDVKALNAMLAARGLGGVVRAVATGEPQGASDADDDDWVDDSDGRVDRSLVSLVAFQPGDDIFCEAPLLHTAAVECTPTGAVDVPQDWQRLLHHYIHLKTASEAGDKDAADALQALALLSTDGVTSSLAQKTDPERITYWRNAARNFLDRLRTKAKKAKKPRPPVTIDEIQRLMQVIETNCHSRDADDGGVDPLDALEALEGSDISEIEEEVGVYLAGSLSNHSCVPNAIVVLHPADDPDPSKASRLSLRCILPIAPEDPITISYTDESFLPMTHRQARLAIRGFKCSCRLCAGQDVVRGLVCSCGDLAVPEPSGKWSCQCGTTPDEKRIAKLDKMEAAYLDLNDEDHDARYKPHATSLARSALARLSPDPVAALDTLASNLKTPLEPLHPTHWLLTSYTRDLIESGMLELLPDETVAARAYLVSADRFVMKRTGMLFDLGYLHDLEGLEKAIEAAQRVGANKVWDGLAEWAKDKAEKQKRVLC